MKKIKIITGPTASGKTAYSLECAKKMKNARIINADASAVYKNFPILTAQPVARSDHLLFEIAEITENFSVAKWLKMVNDIIKEEGEYIIVGGTCMYIFLLINGLVEMPVLEKDLRGEALEKFEALGYERFFQEVVMQDPSTAKDKQRLINNYCLLKQTGKSFGEWQKSGKKYALPEGSFEVIKIMPSREEIYKNCNERFDKMLASGAIEEVEKAIKLYGNVTDFKKIIGVGEIKNYLEGSYTFEEMKEKAKQKTRNLAKSQITWIKNKL